MGAGLGGLAVGIALARKGHVVTIFEEAPGMGEVRNSSHGARHPWLTV